MTRVEDALMSSAMVASRAAPVSRRRPGGRWWWVVAVVVAAGLGVVFGRWALVPPQPETASQAPMTVEVTALTVGRSLPLAVSATWQARPFGVGAASGVLTSVDVADGGTVEVGDRLYTVDLRPVVAAVGEVPAFRDLSQGARGDDVTQLQQFLVDTGFLTGSADGVFGSGTTRAVRAWQRSLGVERDGVVRAGDVVFASRLPARVRVADEVAVGARLSPGDAVLSVLDGAPQFRALVPQASNTDPSLPIEVTFDGEPVEAVVAGTRNDTSGNTFWTLTRPDETPVCADRCDDVPLEEGEAVYPSRQILLEEVTGPGVPAAAVWFTPSGDPYVVLADGAETPVTIRGQGQGGVVLEGVDLGTTVVLPGETETASADGS